MRSLSVLCVLAQGVGLALSACGSSDAKRGAPPALPEIVYQGGALLAAPQIVTVTFPGDSMAPQLELFGQSVTSSSWWNTVRVGYCAGTGGICVGDGPPGASTGLTIAPAASYTDSAEGGASSLQDWISSALLSGALPTPDASPTSNTVYVIYFPSTTQIILDGQSSCGENGFEGYHNVLTFGSQQIAYAVVDECEPQASPFPSIPTITLLQNTTITASHEIVEVATDPNPPTGYALSGSDLNNWAWLDVSGGGEAADLCEDQFGLNQDETTDGTFTVQRIWSAARAASGLEPCIPAAAGEAYFNAAPTRSFFVLNVGGSVTFDVEAFSDRPIGDWTLTAQDWSNSTTTTYLAFSIAGGEATDAGPQIEVNNGSKVTITVTLLQDPGALDTGEADGSLISFSSDPNNPAAAHYWPIAVMSPADAADAGINPAVSTGRRVLTGRKARSPRTRIIRPRRDPIALRFLR